MIFIIKKESKCEENWWESNENMGEKAMKTKQ
jgi:hypothetical protein